MWGNIAIGFLELLIVFLAVYLSLKHRKANYGTSTSRETALFIFVFLSALVGLCLTIGVGFDLQKYLVAAVTQPQPTLYETANGDALVWFPSLTNWLRTAFSLPVVFAAATTAVAAQYGRHHRELFLYSAIASTLSLLLADVVTGIVAGTEIQFFGESLIANPLGGLAIASIVLLVYRLIDAILFSTTDSPFISSVSAGAAAILIGLGINLFCYIAFQTLYDPTSARVDLEVAIPFEGNYSNEVDVQKSNDKKPAFGVLTSPSNIKSKFTYTYVESPLKVDWTRTSNQKVFDVSLLFYSDCMAEGELSKLVKASVFTHKLSDVRRFSVSTDKGQGILFGNLSGNDTSLISLSPSKSITQFGVSKDTDDQYTLRRFLLGDEHLRYWDRKDTLLFSVSAFLMGRRNDGTVSALSRDLRFVVNEREVSVAVKSQRDGIDDDSRLGCSVISKGAPSLSVSQGYETSAGQIGVVVRIEPREIVNGYDTRLRNSLSVRSAGFFWIDKLSSGDLQDLFTNGYADFLAISGLKSLRVDGADVPMASDDTLHLQRSEYHLAMRRDGTMYGEGDVGVIFAKRERLVKTRWERFDGGVQTTILSALTAILLYLAVVLKGLLVRNDVVRWPFD